MRSNWMRTISFMLSLCMIMSFLPMGILAEDGASSPDSMIPADETKVITFVFNVDGAEYGRQNIKSGESLIEPEAPQKASMKFTGWYIDEDTQFTDFGQPMLITADAEITLTAKFEEVYYVYFLNAENGSILVTKEAKDGEAVSVSDVTLHLYADTALTGWKDEAGNTVGDSVTINGANITLTPIISDGYWITYESGSGSTYIWPTFVPPGVATHAPVAPTRPGYVFSHWSLSENGSAYSFGSVLTESITLHAVWTPSNNTQYLVIHWWENPDDTAYAYHESQVLSGTTGSTTAAVAKNYGGFTSQAITQQTIAADGSAIVNVYYNRNVYTVNFKEYVRSGWNGSWQDIPALTITAKYGADIAHLWPSSTSSMWQTSSNSGNTNYQSGIDTMPLGGATFYKPSDDGGRYTMELRYYTEVLDGTVGAHTYNGGNYSLDHKDVFTDNDNEWFTTEEDHYPITGFTYTNNLPDRSSFTYERSSGVYYVEFFYTRNDYNIVFINGGSTESTVTKQYGAGLDDVSHTPARPNNVPAGFTFAGWYDNEDLIGEPVSFAGKTMPAGNMVVYAKWVEPEITATFYSDRVGTANNSILQSLNVGYGSTIPYDQIPIYPVASTYDWIGWVTAEGASFNFDTKLYESVELYPYYVSQNSFIVEYDANGGTGAVPVDSNTYLDYSEATVLPATGLANRGYVFLGWNTAADGSGTTYQPGSLVQIKSSNVKLWAKWGDPPAAGTSLTYDANNGSGETYVLGNLLNNTKHEVLELAETGFSSTTHEFLGWSKSASAKTPDYLPGAAIVLSNGGTNVLYAVWEMKFTSYTVNYYLNNTTDVLVASKTVNNATIGSTVTNETPVAIDGYTPVAGQSANLTLDADAAKNVINFYYHKNVTLTANSSTVKYDGAQKRVSGYTSSDAAAVFAGITVGAGGTDAATYPAKFADSVVGTVDSTGKYIVAAVVDGALTIQPRAITLTSASDSKDFDGTALTNSNVSVSGDGFVKGEGASYNEIGSQTYVGESPNTFYYTLNQGTMVENYAITTEFGKLTVTDRVDKYNITLEANSGSFKYDGTEKKVEGFKTLTFIFDGVTYTVDGVTASASATDAGEYPVSVKGTPIVRDETGMNLTALFNVTTTDGKMTVAKRKV